MCSDSSCHSSRTSSILNALICSMREWSISSVTASWPGLSFHIRVSIGHLTLESCGANESP